MTAFSLTLCILLNIWLWGIQIVCCVEFEVEWAVVPSLSTTTFRQQHYTILIKGIVDECSIFSHHREANAVLITQALLSLSLAAVEFKRFQCEEEERARRRWKAEKWKWFLCWSGNEDFSLLSSNLIKILIRF